MPRLPVTHSLMFSPVVLWALGSVTIVSLVSLVGAALFTVHKHILTKAMLVLISFSTGALFGDVFIHMLPEMVEEGTTGATWLLVLTGILASFVLEKFIHWHHCHGDPSQEHHHAVGIMSLVGDVLHNALDGILVAGSYFVSIEVGIATTIAVVLHEIPQEISDLSILLHSGYTRSKALFFNFLSGLSSIATAIAVLVFQSDFASIGEIVLPFAAGNFLYIAGSDLIPELHKETRLSRGALQLVGIVVGIALMMALTLLE